MNPQVLVRSLAVSSRRDCGVLWSFVDVALREQHTEQGPVVPSGDTEQAGPIPMQVEFQRGKAPGAAPRASAAHGGRA